MKEEPFSDFRRDLWHLRKGGISQLREHWRRTTAEGFLTTGGKRGGLTSFVAGRRASRARNAGRTKLDCWPMEYALSRPKRHQMTAGVILDRFSQLAFDFEWNQVLLAPSRWQQQIEDTQIDLLFIESAWHGNNGLWKGHLTGENAPSSALRDLVQECQRRGIPTVFWNKEDPVHFEDFSETARIFDYVYTTDINMVPQYVNFLGPDRVGVLPFAAQPSIHNPVRLPGTSDYELGDVAFAGTYFRHKYPERRRQMEDIIGGAVRAVNKTGGLLSIYSRFIGVNSNYEFPESWQKYIVGELSYDQMLTAYRLYKLFLNVNSVVDSPSMCARRIFEITACGTPVLTAYSPAIEPFFPEGGVFVAADEDSAYEWARSLIRSPELRDHEVKVGQRQIWREHTYAHRANRVLEDTGLGEHIWQLPSVSALISTNRPGQLEHVARQMSRQRGADFEVLLLTHGFVPTDEQRRDVEELLPEVQWLNADSSIQLGGCYNLLAERAEGQVVAKIDDDDLYGSHYLFDQLMAMEYSGADVVGKGAHFLYAAEIDATVLRFPEAEHKYRDFVSGPTIMARRDLVAQFPFENIRRGEDTAFLRGVRDRGAKIYSSDRFGFMQIRSGASHTWDISTAEILATSELKSYGLATKLAML